MEWNARTKTEKSIKKFSADDFSFLRCANWSWSDLMIRFEPVCAGCKETHVLLGIVRVVTRLGTFRFDMRWESLTSFMNNLKNALMTVNVTQRWDFSPSSVWSWWDLITAMIIFIFKEHLLSTEPVPYLPTSFCIHALQWLDVVHYG